MRVGFAKKRFEKQQDEFFKISEDNDVVPAVFDVPDFRDLRVGAAVVDDNFKLPEKTRNWELSQRHATDQGKTSMRCSAYGTETAKGVMDSAELGRPIYHNADQLWEHQLKTGASEERGDSIQNVLKNLRKHGFVTSGKQYNVTETRRLTDKSLRALMLWLALRKTVVTGIYVRKDDGYVTNYRRAEFNPYGTLKISRGQIIGGHLQACVDYETRNDGVWFFFPNTYGKSWGSADGGVWVHQSEINHTMSKYIIFDARDDYKR